MLPVPSEEQQEICNSLSNGNNVIVNAVAGAGKTTTVLLSMSSVKGPCLLLTYNKLLKENTRKEAEENSIYNLEVHSYNSFGVAYISDKCCTDAGFLDDYEITGVPQYERIYIDEIQDCTYMYYKLIKKLLSTQNNPQIIALGDPRQTIFGFKGANSKYLTLADQIFESTRPWVRLTLRTSYRLTIPMADCMNECVLKENRFESIKPGPPVQLRIMNLSQVRTVVDQLLSQPGVTRNDIFILNYSTKPSPTMIKLENSLKGIPRIVLNDDAGAVDERVTNGKLVISSFHKVKGLGRSKVIVLGFDTGYHYSDRTADTTKCSNPMYVGLSRSTNELILIHAVYQESFSWFMPNDKLLVIGEKKPTNFKQKNNTYLIGVRDFIKFIKPEYEREIRKLITYTTTGTDVIYYISSIVDGKKHGEITLMEEVAEITGIAIPAHAQYKLHHVMQIYADLINEGLQFMPIEHYTTANKLLKLAMYYWTWRNKYIYRKEQLIDYNWISQEDLESISDRLINIINDPTVVFECEGAANLHDFGMQAELRGFADCMSTTGIFEIKCTKELTFEHRLQLMVYAWLFDYNAIKNNTETRKYKLINALSGEVQTVSCSDFPKLMELLTKNKLRVGNDELTDEAFIDLHK